MTDWFQQFLGKLGGKLDAPGGSGAATVRELAVRLAPQVQREIEEQVRQEGGRHFAPHLIRVALPYEMHRSLAETACAALGAEVRETAENFIRDRRYGLLGNLSVQVVADVFRNQPAVRVSFEESGPTATPAALTLRLVTPEGRELQVATLRPNDCLRIGRAQGNSLVLDDSSVSKFHAVLTCNGQGQLVVQDLGSTNGTFVGTAQTRLEGSALVSAGESISFGDIVVKILF